EGKKLSGEAFSPGSRPRFIYVLRKTPVAWQDKNWDAGGRIGRCFTAFRSASVNGINALDFNCVLRFRTSGLICSFERDAIFKGSTAATAEGSPSLSTGRTGSFHCGARALERGRRSIALSCIY